MASFFCAGAIMPLKLVGINDTLSLPHFFPLLSTLFVLVCFSLSLFSSSSLLSSCLFADLIYFILRTYLLCLGLKIHWLLPLMILYIFVDTKAEGCLKEFDRDVWYNAFHIFCIARLLLSFICLKCWGFFFCFCFLGFFIFA